MGSPILAHPGWAWRNSVVRMALIWERKKNTLISAPYIIANNVHVRACSVCATEIPCSLRACMQCMRHSEVSCSLQKGGRSALGHVNALRTAILQEIGMYYERLLCCKNKISNHSTKTLDVDRSKYIGASQMYVSFVAPLVDDHTRRAQNTKPHLHLGCCFCFRGGTKWRRRASPRKLCDKLELVSCVGWITLLPC